MTRCGKRQAATLRAQPKIWTQERVADVLGVDQSTVHHWENPKDVSTFMKMHKGTHAGAKLSPEQRAEIVERVEAGEPQRQIAADFNVSQKAISKTVKSEAKRKEKQVRACNQMQGVENAANCLRPYASRGRQAC